MARKRAGNPIRCHGLAADNQLMAFKHAGFWHPMDTLRDMRLLEQLWRDNRAPWKLW